MNCEVQSAPSLDLICFKTIFRGCWLEVPDFTTSNCPRGYDNAPEEKVISNQSCNPSIDHHFIRNRYLHSLEVILIELAHQAPLSSFRGDENSPNPREGMDTDFFVADRVAKSMSTSLGPSYTKVVRKCLGCDFGEGTTNVNGLGLQAAFYRDVVCELERLETGFMKMQLGPLNMSVINTQEREGSHSRCHSPAY